MKFFKIGLVFLFCLAIIGCSTSGEEGNSGFFCPPCDSDITWQSYGGAVIGNFGNDNWGWSLQNQCGWSIYDNHRGGYGDTLELIGCNGSVKFVWAWQEFNGFHVYDNWQGQTLDAAMMGDSLGDFLAVYPNFYFDRDISGILEYDCDDPTAYAFFEEDSFGVYRLIELRVDWY